MAKVINDSFMVCVDCFPVIANGDASALDYYYREEEAAERLEEIESGIDGAGGYVCPGDSEKDNEFSPRACDCCGSRLHGERLHCIILGE